MMLSLRILTDDCNFTTCCADNFDSMWAEACRLPLVAPIRVRVWTYNSHLHPVLQDSFIWNGHRA